MEENIKEEAAHTYLAVIVDVAQFAELIREETHLGARSADHLGEGLRYWKKVSHLQAGSPVVASSIRTVGPMSCKGPSNLTKLGVSLTIIQQSY